MDNEPTINEDTESNGTKRLYKASDRGQIAGVALGLAEYFDVDPTLVRLLFVILAFTGGPGILAYIILWIIVPDEKDI